LKVFRASNASDVILFESLPGNGRKPILAGSIVGVDGDPLVVTPDGFVKLEEVAPEGRRRMSGADFVRGFRPEPGERLG